uniref:Uncharacterized protein n=1 Tax=Molossus molossus TaxID=27622 RepID=A0A7J8J6W4_MOLMO|nr:hypothetical protein HJG59_009621 [Molossus molossus]
MFPEKLNSSTLPGLDIPARLWYRLPAFRETLLLEQEQDLGICMETLLVADDKMTAFHSTGLKHYLLTVTVATTKAFKHPGIHNPVSLVVTWLVILGPGKKGPQLGPSITQTLHSFCAWQRGLNTHEDPDNFSVYPS